MRKILFTLMVVAVLACPAIAQRYNGFQVQIVDEFGDAVTNLDTIEIQDAGTSTTSTIYSTRAGTSQTNPMTTTSGGFDQSLGLVTWYQSNASFKIVITESGDSLSLTRDNLDSTDTRVAWFVNYIGEAATLQTTDTANLDIGTGDDFTHDWDNTNSRYIIRAASDDSGTLHFGQAALHNDIYWHTGAAITSDYVLFDEGAANVQFIDIDLLLDDEAKLLIGDSSDVTIEYDEANNDLDITSTTALDEICLGADTDGYDFKWFGTTTATYALFDYSADELLLLLADLKISQGSQIEFIDVTDGLTDWTIDNATDETLLIYPTETTDDQSINLGNATNTSDLRIFGATASTVVFDASGDEVIYNAYDISLQDDDQIKFGDGDDWYITSGTAKTLDMIPGATADSTAVLNIGADGAGADFILFGETASQTTWWDASTDQWFFGADAEGVDVTFYTDTTGQDLTLDESIHTLVSDDVDIKLDDDAILFFGLGTNLTTADGDFSMNFTDGSPGYLTLTAVTAEDVFQIGDGTIATDILIQNTTTAGADIFWDDSGELWKFGADNTGVDVGFYGDGTGNYAMFDESIDAFVFVDIDLKMDDATQFFIGTGTNVTTADGDFEINWVSDTRMDITATAANSQVCIGDGTVATDFLVDNITTAGADFWFDQSADTAAGTVYLGIDGKGIDLQLFGDAASSYALWDQSADVLLFVDSDIGMDGESVLLDAVDTTGTKVEVGSPVHIIFLPDAAATLTYTVPTGYDLVVRDAYAYKTAGAGAHADDEWTLQNNDGSAAAIFDKEELNAVGDKARIVFDNLDDGEQEVESGNTLELVALENAGNGCDGIITVVCTFKTAD